MTKERPPDQFLLSLSAFAKKLNILNPPSRSSFYALPRIHIFSAFLVGGHQAGKSATRLVVIPLFMGFWVGDQYMFHKKISFLVSLCLKAAVWVQPADIATDVVGDHNLILPKHNNIISKFLQPSTLKLQHSLPHNLTPNPALLPRFPLPCLSPHWLP